MTQGPNDYIDRLRLNAMLLLKRERELFELRQTQNRTQAWLDAFQDLSRDILANDERSLLSRWARILVENLGFQIAGAYQLDPDEKRMELKWVEPASALPTELKMAAPAITHIQDHPEGHLNRRETSDLSGFAEQIGLDKFCWLHFACRKQSRFLLVGGFSPESAVFHTLSPNDLNHFFAFGNHLSALLANTALIAEVASERSELKHSNARLKLEMAERLRLEKELRHAQKLEVLGHLAAGIGHEINNPLTYLLETIEYSSQALTGIQDDLKDQRLPEILDILKEARRGAERIRNVVGNVRVFSHPSEVPPYPVDVRESLNAAIRMVGNELRHRARLSTRFDGVSEVVADPHRLEQVFVNLIMNAIQALPTGRDADNEIRLSLETDPNQQVLVTFSDNGHGIQEDHMDRIFEPFFTTRKVGQGSGLGLSICRSIVESFGGRITVDSELGSGTTVRVFLRPADAARKRSAESISSKPAPPRSSQPQPARILIVDDEPSVLHSLKRMLSKHETSAVQNGVDALRLYREQPFDLVICDLIMPDFSGIDFYDELKKMGPEHTERIVFMTGGAFTPGSGQFLAKVDNLCLDKPFEIHDLQRVVARHLSRSSSEGNPSAAREGSRQDGVQFAPDTERDRLGGAGSRATRTSCDPTPKP